MIEKKILAAFTATLAVAACTNVPTGDDPNAPLVIAKQGSYFVGGRDVKSDNLSLLPNFAASGTITVDQMYVRYQVPANAKGAPVVLIHGCCLTGKTWETTPDGRMGWDEFFLRKGNPVYVVDQSWRGRSASDITAINAVKSGKAPVDKLPVVYAAGQEGAWAIFRFGPEYPKLFPGMRYPLDTLSEFWKQMVPDWINAAPQPAPTIAALSTLAVQLKGVVLISHSQSGIMPFQTAALDSNGIRGIISIEPAACPDPKGDLKPYTKMPVMVLFGDYVELSPRWAPRLKLCRDFVDNTNKAGGNAALWLLPEMGIKGNSHMLMQDNNSLEIAGMLSDWVAKQVH